MTLIDFGAWYPPYGLHMDDDTHTERGLAEYLRDDGWTWHEGVWLKDGERVVANSLGFVVLESAHPSAWTFNGDVWHQGVFLKDFTPLRAELPDDWRSRVAQALADNAVRILDGWCRDRLVDGMASDSRRLLVRCERIGYAYPPRDKEAFTWTLDAIRDRVRVSADGSGIEYRANPLTPIFKAVGDAGMAAGTLLASYIQAGYVQLLSMGVVVIVASIAVKIVIEFEERDNEQ